MAAALARAFRGPTTRRAYATKYPALDGIGHGPHSFDAVPRQLHPNVRTVLENAYPTVLHVPIQWGEQDAFGHLNNVAVMRYFESARLKYLVDFSRHLPAGMRHAFVHPAPPHPGPIVASVSTRYRAQAHFPDTLTVGLRVRDDDVAKLRAIAALPDGDADVPAVLAAAIADPRGRPMDRFVMDYVMVSNRTGAITADGDASVVVFEYGANAKHPVTPAIARAVCQWEDEGRAEQARVFAASEYSQS